MSYPEKGANYRNKPAWMDRAVASEKRAQGGPVSIGNRSVGNGAGVRDVTDAATEDAGDDLSYAMNKPGSDRFHDSGIKIPGKLKAQNDKAWPQPTPRREVGGSVDNVDENQRIAARDLSRGVANEQDSNPGESGARKSARDRLSSNPFTAMAAGAYANKSRTTTRDRADHQGPTYTRPKITRPVNLKTDDVDGFKAGGRVRHRAEGGNTETPAPLVDRRGRTLQQLAADDPSGEPLSLKSAASPSAAQDAREQAAERTRRAATSPREPGPITKSLVAAGATPLVLGRITADTVGRAANRINNPEAKDRVANGVGQTMRRRGGGT